MEGHLSTSTAQRPPQKHIRTGYLCLRGPLFLSILAGVDPDFPKFMWDNILNQTKFTLNLLLQATINPRISVWEFFNGSFEFAETPLRPIGCKVIIHKKITTRKYWDQHGRECYNTGTSLKHYRCLRVVDMQKKELEVLDTVEFLQSYLRYLTVTTEYRISHAIHLLLSELKDVLSTL